MQAETTFHSQFPLERLYAGLTNATKHPDNSAELLRKMQDAIQVESGRVQSLRAELATMTSRASASDGADATLLLSGLQALMKAKLKYMRGGMVGGTGTGGSLGGLPIMHNQFETGAGNVLSLA